jgi:hypothetical protein
VEGFNKDIERIEGFMMPATQTLSRQNLPLRSKGKCEIFPLKA